MNQTLRAAVKALAADAESGASELLPRAIELLRLARAHGQAATIEAARAVCAAQPSMGSFCNAAAAALADMERPGALEAFDERVKRAQAAIVRFAVELLGPAPPQDPEAPAPLFITFSFSGSVLALVRTLARLGSVSIACAEGRPRLEGRRLAVALATDGIRVDFYTDAALGGLVAEADAVLLGADAITPHWFLNKCGTTQLAAAASWAGVPVFVIAGRDKFLPASAASLLSVGDHPAGEIWEAAPPGVAVRNPYFERVPLDHVTAVITDAGVLGVDMVEEACRGNEMGLGPEILARLAPHS